jgi:hypothetical protein
MHVRRAACCTIKSSVDAKGNSLAKPAGASATSPAAAQRRHAQTQQSGAFTAPKTKQSCEGAKGDGWRSDEDGDRG